MNEKNFLKIIVLLLIVLNLIDMAAVLKVWGGTAESQWGLRMSEGIKKTF